VKTERDLDEDLFIQKAFRFLEKPSFLLRVANTVGRPLESALRVLPAKQRNAVAAAAQTALHKGLLLVTRTLPRHGDVKTFAQAERSSRVTSRWHSAAAFGAGAAGGFFGFFALPLELPVTTGIILRSIAAVADEFGMDLEDPRTQLECLYILSLGSPRTTADDALSSAYWSSRAAYSTLIADAAKFLAGKSGAQIASALERKTATMLVKFLTQIDARFEVVVSEKVVAEAVPVVGAVGGGLINAAFADYFSEAARYHFGLRALEEKYGRERVERRYLELNRKTE